MKAPFLSRACIYLASLGCDVIALAVLRYRKNGLTPLFEIGCLLLVCQLLLVASALIDAREGLHRSNRARLAAQVLAFSGRMFVPVNTFLYIEGLLPLQSTLGVVWLFSSFAMVLTALVLGFLTPRPPIRELGTLPAHFALLGIAELVCYVVWIVGA